MPTDTTNYGLQKPLINNAVDQDTWGSYLNDDMDDIDGLMKKAFNWTPSVQSLNFSVTAPTTGSTTTGSAKVLYRCDATLGTITASLPTAATCTGMTVAFKKMDASANTVVLDGNGAETIDGAATVSLTTQYQWIIVSSNGVSWDIVSQKQNISLVVPTVQKFTSSSGTYTTPASVLYLEVTMVGGGGGGGGAGGAGGAGGTSTFGTWTAIGGSGGLQTGSWTGGAGGTGGVDGTGTVLKRQSGARGASGNGEVYAAAGGATPFGGAGVGASVSGTSNGASAVDNTGSGGGGCLSGTSTSGAGGASEYVHFIISSPSASYSYAVGAAGTAGSGAVTGGAGGSGFILVKEFYQ